MERLESKWEKSTRAQQLLILCLVISYFVLLHTCLSQTTSLALLSEQNNELRTRLSTVTKLVAKDHHSQVASIHSKDFVKQTRILDLLNDMISHQDQFKNNQELLGDSTSLAKSLNTLKSDLAVCQERSSQLMVALDQTKAEVATLRTTTPVVVVEKTTRRPTKPATTAATKFIPIIMDIPDFTDDDDDEEEIAIPRKSQSSKENEQRNCVPTFEFDQKRTGGSVFKTLTTTSANRCKRLCLAEEKCVAWVFEDTKCVFMEEPGESEPNKCCVSGVRCR